MYIVQANNKSQITLGRQGENLARQVVFDLSDWVSGYGDGVAELIYQRPGDAAPYPVAAVREDSTLVWTLTAIDTAVASAYGSYGHCELRWYVGDVLTKSQTWRTWVDPAMDTPTETAPPAPERGWVEQVLSARVAAQQAAEAAKADADSAAKQANAAEQSAQDAQSSADAAKEDADFIREETQNINRDIAQLRRDVDDLLYEPINITGFTSSVSTAELGSTVNAVTLAWSLNKEPQALELEGDALDTALRELLVEDAHISANKTWTLTATDERGTSSSKTASITFLNGVYYGVAAAPETVDSTFLLGLSKVLSGTRARTITVDAGEDQYIWYAIPARLGACTFKVGGFEGGFDLVATIDFTNASGYTEPYRVYRSAQSGLGKTTVEVS